MIAIVNALVPVLVAITVGRFLGWRGLINDQQWAGLETICYQILFPALIILAITSTDFAALPIWSLSGALLSVIATMCLFLILMRKPLSRWINLDGPSFTSVFQGVTRWNTFIALAIAASLYGESALALMAIAIVALIPILNVINVTMLSLFASGESPSVGRILRELAINPFIWSTALALAINLSGITLPQAIIGSLELLGRAALGLSLMTLGGGLQLEALRRPGPRLMLAIVLRLIAMPILAAGYAAVFGVTGIALGVAILAFSVPTASASYILARKMGGNAPLMAEILTLQAIFSLGTLPLMLLWFGP